MRLNDLKSEFNDLSDELNDSNILNDKLNI